MTGGSVLKALSLGIERVDRSRFGLPLAFALLFAFIRGLHLVYSWSRPILNDAQQYDHLAWALAQGEPWVNWQGALDWQFGPNGTPTAVRTPGLPLFLAPIYALFGHQPIAGRTALVLFNAVAAGALFYCLRQRFRLATAVAVSLAWVFWPVSVRALYYVDSLLAESLAVPLTIFALCALCFEGLRAAALAGVFLGLAILTRPHLGPTLLVIPLLGFVSFRALRAERKRLIVCTFCAALCLLPWMARNYSAFGRFMPLSSQSGLGLWIGWAPGTDGSWVDNDHEDALVAAMAERHPELLAAPEPRKSEIFGQAAREAIAELGVAGVVQRALWKAWLFVRPWEAFYGFHSALFFATLLALCAGRSLWGSAPLALSTSICLGVLLTSVVTFYLGRYRFVCTPALLFLAAAGLERVLGRVALLSLRHPSRRDCLG